MNAFKIIWDEQCCITLIYKHNRTDYTNTIWPENKTFFNSFIFIRLPLTWKIHLVFKITNLNSTKRTEIGHKLGFNGFCALLLNNLIYWYQIYWRNRLHAIPVGCTFYISTCVWQFVKSSTFQNSHNFASCSQVQCLYYLLGTFIG